MHVCSLFEALSTRITSYTYRSLTILGSRGSSNLSRLSKPWQEYAKAANLEENQLPVTLSLNETTCFHHSTNKGLERALHLPTKGFCPPLLILQNKAPSVTELNRQA